MKKELAVEYAVKNTFFLYISNLIIEVVNLFISIYIIRKLSVETFGFYNFILGSMFFVQILTISSIATIISRFVPEMIEKASFKLLHKFTLWAYTAVFIFLILVSFAFYIFRSQMAVFFKLSQLPNFTVPIILYMFSYILLQLTKSYMSASLLQKEVTFSNISASFFRIILYIIFLSHITLYQIFLIETAANSVNGILQFIVFVKYLMLNMQRDTGEKLKNLRARVLKYGVLSFFNEMGAGMISKASSYYVISAMSDSYKLGQYSFAYKMNDIFMKIFPIDQISNVLKPIFFRKYVSSNEHGAVLNKMYVFLYKFLLWLLVPLCFYFISVSDIIIVNIFDPKYLNAAVITNIIFMFILFNAFQMPLGYVVLSMEKLEINLISKVFLIYNILGSIFIIKDYGLIGVAVILGSSILFKNLSILFMLRKYIKLSFPLKSIFKLLSAGMLIILFNIYFKKVPGLHPYIFLMLSFAICMSGYYFVTRAFKPFSIDEKEIVNMIFSKMKMGFLRI